MFTPFLLRKSDVSLSWEFELRAVRNALSRRCALSIAPTSDGRCARIRPARSQQTRARHGGYSL